MEYGVRIEADGSGTLIDCSGNPVGRADKDGKTLHLIPKLLLDEQAARGLKLANVTLELLSAHREALVPSDGIRVRQPYPNANYLVGGSDQQRNGWCISAEKLPSEFDLEFRWVHHSGDPADSRAPRWVVRHQLRITLQEGAYRTYTMAVNCWPRVQGAAAPLYRQPLAFVRKSQATSEYLNARTTLRLTQTGLKELTLAEHVVIPPIPYEQAVAINAFQEEQLHEREQVSTYTAYGEAHFANGSAALPAALLLEAIHLARTVDYDEDPIANGEDKTGQLEKHPAMRLLSEWWEANRPDKPGAMHAGYAMPLVRAQDDGEYWTGYLEFPNVNIPAMAPFASSSATCGEGVLVQFFASAVHCTYPSGVFQTHLADGTRWSDCSADQAQVADGSFDEAWYCLEALAYFPTNFPAAYRALKAVAGG